MTGPTAMAALRGFTDSSAVDEAARQAAVLVLDELLTNIISYGLKDSRHGPITLELDIIDEKLQIRITDGGIPFNPFDKPDPDLDIPLEQRQPGGSSSERGQPVRRQFGGSRPFRGGSYGS